jgi:hypothetical protein
MSSSNHDYGDNNNSADNENNNGCCWLWLARQLDSHKFTILLVLALVLLFKIRSPLQFYVKFGVYMVMTIVYSTFVMIFALLRPNNTKNIE